MKIATIDDILRTRSRATFPYRINFETIGYQNLPQMKDWCEQNCKDLWRVEHTFALYFQFSDERDATMFMLKWGTAHGNKLR